MIGLIHLIGDLEGGVGTVIFCVIIVFDLLVANIFHVTTFSLQPDEIVTLMHYTQLIK